MSQMSPGTARQVDAVTTAVVRGFEHPEHVGHYLFPTVNVAARGGRIIQFNRDSFRLYNTARAPGGATKRVTFGYGGAPYALVDHSLEAVVPRETAEEAQQVGVDMSQGPLYETSAAMDLGLEKERADIARTAASYGASNKIALTGVDRFDTTTGKPAVQFRIGREAVRAKIGRYPNLAVIPAPAFEAMCDNGDVRDYFKYTSADSISADMMARYLRVPKVVVAEPVYVDDSDVQQDVWGKDIILAYVNVTPLARRWFGTPSAFYTYQLNGYPYVETPYEDRNSKSAIYPITNARQPVGAGFDAAYLMQTVIS